MDISGIAAEIIWTNLYLDWNKSKINFRRKIFLKNVVKDLVLPNIKRRNISFLPKSCVTTIHDVLGNSYENLVNDDVVPDSANVRRRSYLCPLVKGRDSKQVCSTCKKNVCNEHSQKIVC